jgi:WD40 repeat protein
MNGSVSCLTPERLRQLSADELSPPELEELEEHVTHCESCRCALEAASAEPDWRQEVRDALTDVSVPEGWSRLADSTDDGSHDACAVEPFLKLLGPTDDPHMLGRIGTYEIVGILGRGGMGVVFKGFDSALNRYVSIKMLLPHLATSGGARKRFAREAQAAAAVVHDHVMAIHSVAEWQGVPYLVMPYGRGISLQKRLSDKGPLEVREILRIGMQTAAGLAAAHAQGLVHRDVKPANILLDDGVERVTLTDFGLARAVDDASLTRIGVLAGTPQYMSPEQARGNAIDARSDLFSLGSVLYAMCTGRSPFRADSSYGVLRLITDDEPTPIREINPEIPDWLCAIVGRLMAKRPEERFSTASEVAELLEGCLAHVQQPTAVALPSSVARPTGKSVFGQRQMEKFITGVLVMVATLALGFVAMLAWQETAPPDIAGVWTGEGWGAVVLEAKQPGKYEGSYKDADHAKSGAMQLKWSRAERRFNGTWEDADKRSGKMSLRLVDDEIRGAWTTGKSFPKESGTARLADLLWKRSSDNVSETRGGQPIIDRRQETNKASMANGDTSVLGGSRSENDTVSGVPGLRDITYLGNPFRSHRTTTTTSTGPKLVRRFQTNAQAELIAYSEDGKLIAIAHGGSILPVMNDWKRGPEILDAETGKTIVALQLTTKDEYELLAAAQGIPIFKVDAIAFSPAGSVVAVGTSAGQVKLFNARTGELLRSLDDEPAKVGAPENLKSFQRAMGDVTSLAFSPDGNWLAVCGRSFAEVARDGGGLSTEGFTVTDSGQLKVWEVKTGKLKHDLMQRDANVVAFSPDGNLLASAGTWHDGLEQHTGVSLWNPNTGARIRTISHDANGGTHAVAFSPNGKFVVIGSLIYDKHKEPPTNSTTSVSLVHVATSEVVWQQTIPGWANPKAFSPDGSSVVVLCGRESIRFLETETGRIQLEIRSTDTPHERWFDFAITPRGPTLAISAEVERSLNGSIELWDIAGRDIAASSSAVSGAPSAPVATDGKPRFVADLEFIVDKELRYRTKADPEWRSVLLAGVSNLLSDGQTVAIHANADVPYEWIKEIINMTSQRKDMTVTVVPLIPDGTESVLPLLGATTGGPRRIPGIGSATELRMPSGTYYFFIPIPITAFGDTRPKPADQPRVSSDGGAIIEDPTPIERGGDELSTSYQEFAAKLGAMNSSIAEASEDLKLAEEKVKNGLEPSEVVTKARRQVEAAIRNRKAIQDEYAAVLLDLDLQIESARAEFEAARGYFANQTVLQSQGAGSQKEFNDSQLRVTQTKIKLDRLKVRQDLYKKAGEGLATDDPLKPSRNPFARAPASAGPLDVESTAKLIWETLGVKFGAPVDAKRAPPKYRGGLPIVEISENGAAAKAGFRKQDILVGLDVFETRSLDNVAFVLRNPATQLKISNSQSIRAYLARNGETLLANLLLESKSQ